MSDNHVDSTRNTTVSIGSNLTLPCGARLSNRLCKAAMTEGLGDERNRATEGHERLYRRWSEGGAGLLLTGNVQIDRRHLERPGNVAIAGEQDAEALERLRRFAAAGTSAGNHLWMQLSHAGRQTPATVNKTPLAPSDVALEMPGGQFGKPRPMTEADIRGVIEGFAVAARTARETGFTGVQVHSAHGYLLSEFLSPDVNLRTDEWGGSLENRSRLLREVVRAARKVVGDDFPVSVKLNSADFQRGGFSHEDAIAVAKMLDRERIDLLEVSGGTYEQPRMVRNDGMTLDAERAETPRASTIAREAYFLKYADDIRRVVAMPLLVTGGFRSVQGMNAALASGAADVVGIARPMCIETDLPAKLLDGRTLEATKYEDSLRLGPTRFLGPASPISLFKVLNGFGVQGWYCLQLLRMGEGLEPDVDKGVFRAFFDYTRNELRAAKRLVA